MNWYKTAQKKTFDEILRGLESNPEVDRAVLSWLKTLPSDKMGPAANMLMKNPRATVQEIEAKFPKVVPLTTEQEQLIANYPLIREWMRGILIGSSVSKREAVFNILREKAARIRDWAERTQAQMQGRSLESAVKETEKWHKESAAIGKGEYLPTQPEDIVIKYPNGFTWQRVSRGIDAKIEGNKMNHCVGNYCEDVDEGKINVYSLRDKNNAPLVTAGFKYDNKVVVQMKGKDDINPVGQGYSKYISDILAKLGAIYNDGEKYLREGFDLKELNYLTIEDIEKDNLVKTIAHNAIVREGSPPDFAFDWAKKTLNSGNAPKEWMDGINKYLVKHQDVPDFALDWAREKLDSGKVSQELMDAINKYLVKHQDIPYFASNWAKKTLESGNVPKEWMDAINKRIAAKGDVPKFAKDWAKDALKSGNAPREWTDILNRYIEKWGSPPYFAEDWAKNILESGNAPKAWTDKIHMTYVPLYAEDWVKKTLESGNAPKEWMNDIEKNLNSAGLSPVVKDWIKQVLDSGNAPQEWIDAISKHIVKNGYPPYFADDWANKILDSGNAPQKWIDAISKFIVENGNQENPPEFAADWAKNALESGNAPRALINAINNFIEKYADVPKFAINWAKNVLNSGKIPQKWMYAIVDRIEKNGEPPMFASEWARISLNSLVGPIELEQAVYFHIDNNSYIPEFASEWAEKTGLLEKLRSEQLE